MSELANEGVTMIVVTHELDFAKEAATKVVFMDGGNVIEQGPPEEIFVSQPRREQDNSSAVIYRNLPIIFKMI